MIDKESVKQIGMDRGSEAPPFIGECVFNHMSNSDIHIITIDNRKNQAPPTTISAVFDNGGYVEFDDGVTIRRRVFREVESAVLAFKEEVEATITTLNTLNLNPDTAVEYDPGQTPVDFDRDL